jgi:DNA-binding response OmpR family regulator
MAERLSSTTHAGSRILIVEDHEDLRTLMVLVLEHDGYRVDAARSAEEAFRLLMQHSYDLVLSDYGLPGRSGTWLLREALARHLVSSEQGIILTAHPFVTDAGPFPVIHKPFDFEALLAHIHELVDTTADSPAPSADQQPAC